MTQEIENPVSLILYTTLYREGGPKFKRAAETKYREMRQLGLTVRCKAVESKAEFLKAITELAHRGERLDELHFFGHSGMYGIMFGTVQWPEQFSPYEWRQMSLPVTEKSRLYFHACRSGRWFAPFIARTLGVHAYGYHNYTTVSLSPDRFIWEGLQRSGPEGQKDGQNDGLYIVACPGRKSHGVLASAIKYLLFPRVDAFLEYTPDQVEEDTSYDAVAASYEQTFEDIIVRRDELNWLESKLEEIRPARVLDIGCGNGAFLDRLSSSFEEGVGVDLSAGMLNQARRRSTKNPKLSFAKIDGPKLPFPDNSFDVITSTLSFRYLDWDPMLEEILRVLKPGGRFLVIDMVTAPVKWKEWGALIRSKIRMMVQQWMYRRYYQALKAMVNSPAWRKMLKHNPIRSEHEMRWYLESRFSGRKAEIINVGFRSRILAFDSGKVTTKFAPKMSFP